MIRFLAQRNLLALPLLLGLGGATLLSRGAAWLGEVPWTLDVACGSTVLSGPVVAAVAAWNADRSSNRYSL